MTNTGFYVVEPAFLKTIPKETFIHMTDLIQNLIDNGEPVGVYPVGESDWLDMGQPDSLDKMRERFG